MAKDWIGRLAEEARIHDEQQLKQQQHRLHEAQITAEKSQSLWDALVASIERDVSRFQEEFAGDMKRSLVLEKIQTEVLRVYRPESPSVSLDLEFRPTVGEIGFKHNTSTVNKHITSGWSGTLVIRVDPDDTLYLNQYGRDFFKLDEVSRMLLEPVLTGAAF